MSEKKEQHPQNWMKPDPNQTSGNVKVSDSTVDEKSDPSTVRYWTSPPTTDYWYPWYPYHYPQGTASTNIKISEDSADEENFESLMEFGLLEEVFITFPDGSEEQGYFIKEENGMYVIAAELRTNSPTWVVDMGSVDRISLFENQENLSANSDNWTKECILCKRDFEYENEDDIFCSDCKTVMPTLERMQALAGIKDVPEKEINPLIKKQKEILKEEGLSEEEIKKATDPLVSFDEMCKENEEEFPIKKEQIFLKTELCPICEENYAKEDECCQTCRDAKEKESARQQKKDYKQEHIGIKPATKENDDKMKEVKKTKQEDIRK